jgi:hypothetical protein
MAVEDAVSPPFLDLSVGNKKRLPNPMVGAAVGDTVFLRFFVS